MTLNAPLCPSDQDSTDSTNRVDPTSMRGEAPQLSPETQEQPDPWRGLPYEALVGAERRLGRFYQNNKKSIHKVNKKARTLSNRFEQFWVDLAKKFGIHLATSQKSEGPYLVGELVDDDLRRADLLLVEAEAVPVSPVSPHTEQEPANKC